MNNTQKTPQTAPTRQSPPNGSAGQSGQTERSYDDATFDASRPRREAGAVVEQGGQPSPRDATTTLLPPVDIFEDETGFTVMADLPGVSKDQLGVRVTGDSLVIEGTASVPVTGNLELVYGEIQNPRYQRSFTLSRELDPGKIEARLINGVLTLRIPKAEEAKPRRIEVSVG